MSVDGSREQRCEKTDLLVSMCAHCRPEPPPTPAPPPRPAEYDRDVMLAKFDGWCREPSCSDRHIQAGVDEISPSPYGDGWIHADCR